MKKILLIIALFLSAPVFAANTTEYRDGSVVVTIGQLSLASTTTSDGFLLGPYQSGSLQCVWASITGPNSTFILQFSNDNSNWDDVSGAATTTSGASGSGTWIIEPMVSRYARVKVSSASTTGTLNCISVLKKF